MNAVAIAADGTLASGGNDKKVRLWTAAGKAGDVFDAKAYVLRVAFVPGGPLLAAATADGRLLIWDVAAKELVASARAHKQGIEALACSPDGKRLVTATGWGEKSVRLWDPATGQELLTLVPPLAFPNDACFTNDGQLLVVVGDTAIGKPGGSIAIWDARPAPAAAASPETKIVDQRDLKQRPFFDVLLSAENRTTDPMTLHLRFMQREGGADVWLPSKETYAKYTLAPGKRTKLLYKKVPVTARRVRFWAEGPDGKVVADQRRDDLALVPLDGYLAPERQTFTLVLPRK